MRIIDLIMNAFGPYPDLVHIDFTKLNLEKIFLITGPTGSGKTTIFDAISYALFSSASGNDKSVEYLRSQYADPTSETYVKLVFEINENRYEITRYPKQTIVNRLGKTTTRDGKVGLVLPDGTVIERVNEVDARLKKILKISAKQFKQVVMLPQGEFKELLFANSRDREAIFREIFGTQLYQTFQNKLADDLKEKKKTVEIIANNINQHAKEIEIEGFTYSEDIINIIYEESKSGVSEKDYLDKHFSEIFDGIKKDTEELDKLKKEIKKIEKSLDELKQELHNGEEINKKLTKYNNLLEEKKELENKSSEIEKKRKLAKHIDLLKLFKTKEEYIKKEERKLLELENDLKDKKEEEDKNEKSLKGELEKKTKASSKVITLEDIYKESITNKNRINDFYTYDELVKKVKDLKNDQEKISSSIEKSKKTIEDNIKKTEECSNENKKLEKLISTHVTVLEEKNNLEKEILVLNDVVSLHDKINKEQKKLDKSTELLKKSLAKYDKTSEEYKNQFSKFYEGYAGILAKELKDGERCPVCGSLEHPLKATSIESDLTKEDLDEKKKEVDTYEKEVEVNSKEVEASKQSISSEEARVQEILSKNGIEIGLDYQKILKEKEEKKDNCIKTLGNIDLAKKEKEANDNKICDLTKEQETQEKLLDNYQTQYNSINTEIGLQNERIKKLEKIIPDSYIDAKTLETSCNKNIKEYDDLVNIVNDSEKRINDLTKDIANLTKDITKTTKQVDEQRNVVEESKIEFDKEIIKEFASIDNYLEALKEEKRIDELNKEVKEYDLSVSENKSLLNDKEKEIKGLKEVDLSKIEEKITSTEKDKSSNTKESEKYSIRINHNKKKIDLVKKEINNYLKEKQVEEIFNNLDSISSGRKGNRITFERYILSSYFEDILFCANNKLKEMTSKRYEFIKKDTPVRGNAAQGLDIDIFDNNTGKSRDVKSLSGGEQFKASLALALGLSEVIQTNLGGVEINTLFIDEGFGSLDEESLDVAINTLLDIHSADKVIGIISHVQELKNRINAKIVITKTKKGSTVEEIA